MKKNNLRPHFLQQRAAIADDQRKTFHQRIFERVLALEQYQNAKHIAFYWNDPDEVATRVLIQDALAQKKSVYLPYVTHKALSFMGYDSKAPLVTNRFGIEEPDPATSKLVKFEMLDIIVMPLVAFDAECHRLGRGAGHYDRTLATVFHTEEPNPKHPILIGLAYACQQADEIPVDHWDIPLDILVTERHTLFKP